MGKTGVSSGVSKRRPSFLFKDAAVEHEFQAQYFRDNVVYIRAALLLGIVTWAFFGLFLPAERGQEEYLVVYLVGAGVTALFLGLSFAHGFARWWQIAIVGLIVVSAALSEMHRMITGHPAHWTGVVGLMMVLAFAYALFRLQYRYAAIAGVLAIICYNVMRGSFKLRETSGSSSPMSTS